MYYSADSTVFLKIITIVSFYSKNRTRHFSDLKNFFNTLVQSTGAANIMESPQTTISDLLQLVMVHKDLDFIGKTMTINLKDEPFLQTSEIRLIKFMFTFRL